MAEIVVPFIKHIPAFMRKIILSVAVSLDGFIEGPNGEYDWCFVDQDYGRADFFKRIDTLFIGRKTYELMQKTGDNASPGFPKFTEYVFSTKLKKVKVGTTLISGDIKNEVEKIKKQPGKDIRLFGGASLTASILDLGLVDELDLAVHPVLVGGGKPLFNNINERTNLKLDDTKTYSSGLVKLQYSFL